MRKLTIIPAALLLAGCAAPAEPVADPAPVEQVEPTAPVGEVPTAFPMDTSHLTEPPPPGLNTVTLTAYSNTDDSQAYWGHAMSDDVAELSKGVVWTATLENVDASEWWSVNVIGDMVSRDAEVSCTIKVDGQLVSEETTTGQGASAYCETGTLTF